MKDSVCLSEVLCLKAEVNGGLCMFTPGAMFKG